LTAYGWLVRIRKRCCHCWRNVSGDGTTGGSENAPLARAYSPHLAALDHQHIFCCAFISTYGSLLPAFAVSAAGYIDGEIRKTFRLGNNFRPRAYNYSLRPVPRLFSTIGVLAHYLPLQAFGYVFGNVAFAVRCLYGLALLRGRG
jgi:hypothetical protein